VEPGGEVKEKLAAVALVAILIQPIAVAVTREKDFSRGFDKPCFSPPPVIDKVN
jgi:hypothetical protein